MYYNHYYYILCISCMVCVSTFHLVVPVLYYIFYLLYTKQLKNKHAFVKHKKKKNKTHKCYVRACWPGLGRQLVNCLNGYFCNVLETAARKKPKIQSRWSICLLQHTHSKLYVY